MTFQRLTYHLEGITAGDYLAWVRDPEPPGLGHGLRSISVDADPLGTRIDFVLEWDGAPPPPRAAEILAGVPVTEEVVRADCRRLESVAA